MLDRREEILFNELSKSVDEKGLPIGDAANDSLVFKLSAISAMDEYMKETCLELLDYMLKHCIAVGINNKNDEKMFLYKTNMITKEQLFENFL